MSADHLVEAVTIELSRAQRQHRSMSQSNLSNKLYQGCDMAEAWRCARRSWPSLVRALTELGYYGIDEQLDTGKTHVVAWLNGNRFEL